MKVTFFISLLLISLACTAADYSWLKEFDTEPNGWKPEISADGPFDPGPQATANLQNYYSEFEKDKVISIGMVSHYGLYKFKGISHFLAALTTLFMQEQIGVTEFSHDENMRQIRFKRKSDSVVFVIDYAYDRNSYKEFLSDHEVVMYHGYSRYGRGPSFDGYDDYFRMGLDWETVEVDARNNIFNEEPWMLRDTYPVKTKAGKKYQYIGARINDSLPDLKTMWVKNIPGKGMDFQNGAFKPDKQIFWYHSSKSKFYWHSSIRKKFPDIQEKLAFGTTRDTGWSIAPAVIFIADLVARRMTVDEIKGDLDSTDTCGNDCWAVY